MSGGLPAGVPDLAALQRSVAPAPQPIVVELVGQVQVMHERDQNGHERRYIHIFHLGSMTVYRVGFDPLAAAGLARDLARGIPASSDAEDDASAARETRE